MIRTLLKGGVLLALVAGFLGSVSFHPPKRGDHARIALARAQAEAFMTALMIYHSDTGTFPHTEQGLAALRAKPADVESWNGPYISREVPLDPWGNGYVYNFPGPNPNEPGILSLGADGLPGGEGINSDIVSWKN